MGLDRITAMTLATQTFGRRDALPRPGSTRARSGTCLPPRGAPRSPASPRSRRGGFRTTFFIKAVERATQRSRELGRGRSDVRHQLFFVALANLVNLLIVAYIWIISRRASFRGEGPILQPLVRFLNRVTEPVLRAVRERLRRISSGSTSSMIVILVLYF